jgi:hypothetical protein
VALGHGGGWDGMEWHRRAEKYWSSVITSYGWELSVLSIFALICMIPESRYAKDRHAWMHDDGVRIS